MFSTLVLELGTTENRKYFTSISKLTGIENLCIESRDIVWLTSVLTDNENEVLLKD